MTKRVLYRVLPFVVALLVWAALPDGFSREHPWRMLAIVLALNVENVMGYWECASKMDAKYDQMVKAAVKLALRRSEEPDVAHYWNDRGRSR